VLRRGYETPRSAGSFAHVEANILVRLRRSRIIYSDETTVRIDGCGDLLRGVDGDTL
jgi:hypothetical protein